MKVYGIDTKKPVTAIMIRDAIIVCFEQAHAEILDMMDGFAEWENDEEREKFRKIQSSLSVRNAFKDANVEWEKPTKKNLPKVLDELAKQAKEFRKPKIISKHYKQIMELIEKIE